MRKSMVVVGCGTEVIVQHTVLCALIDTTLLQYGYWQGIEVVLVSEEQLVGIANQRVVHGAVSQRLVGILQDVVLLRRSAVLDGTQCREFQILERLPLQFQLELGISHVQVDVVALQLMQDVECCIVGMIICIRIQRTGCVQGVRIWVDIEVTLHLT